MMVCWVVAVLLGRAVGDTQAARLPHADPAAVYRTETEHGFTLHVHPRLRDHPAETAVMRAELAAQLAAIARVVPAGPLAELRRVPIWLEWRLKPNGAAEYHRSAGWLAANGYNPAKAGGVEVANAVNFVRWSRGEQPWMLLHELAHAYHFRVLGDRHPGIEAAYRQAADRRLYEAVDYVRGGRRRAYAVVNSGEYFAELTEAYFGRNDFFPFTRPELERHDPAGFALMEAVWGRPAADPHDPTQPVGVSVRWGRTPACPGSRAGRSPAPPGRADAPFRPGTDMGNHMKGCGCRMCRRGMHTKTGGKQVQRVICSVRRAVKRALRRGEEPPPTRSVGYTD